MTLDNWQSLSSDNCHDNDNSKTAFALLYCSKKVNNGAMQPDVLIIKSPQFLPKEAKKNRHFVIVIVKKFVLTKWQPLSNCHDNVFLTKLESIHTNTSTLLSIVQVNNAMTCKLQCTILYCFTKEYNVTRFPKFPMGDQIMMYKSVKRKFYSYFISS